MLWYNDPDYNANPDDNDDNDDKDADYQQASQHSSANI